MLAEVKASVARIEWMLKHRGLYDAKTVRIPKMRIKSHWRASHSRVIFTLKK